MIISSDKTFLLLESKSNLNISDRLGDEQINRSYPALSSLDEDNRSYPLLEGTENTNLTQEEATELLNELNDPLLEYLLNQDSEEESSNIFDEINSLPNDTGNLIEAFFADPETEVQQELLVFSDLYA